MFTVDPSIATAPITPTTNSAPTQALVRSLLGQSTIGNETTNQPSFQPPPPPPPPPQPSAELMQHFQQQRQNQHPYETLTEIMGGGSANKK